MEHEGKGFGGSSEYWDKRSETFGKASGRNRYTDEFIDKLNLDGTESVFDMGCATGTLALPLARAGHTVFACDFSPKMLERLEGAAAQEKLPIKATLMAWQDDWNRFGFEPDSVDVAVASRSISFGDLGSALDKLECVAQKKMAITVPAGPVPAFDTRLMEYLGRVAPPNRIDAEAIGILAAKGRHPELSYIVCERPMRFDSLDYAKSELLRLAGKEPLDDRESDLFERYLTEHFKIIDQGGTMVYQLDYTLTSYWAFIVWAKDA